MAQVIVACKLPNGHVLHHGETVVELNGGNHPRAIAGFGLTEVDEAFYKAWEENARKNKYQPFVAGLIFAHAKRDSVEAAAEEREDVQSGFEGMPQEEAGIEALNKKD